VLLDYRNARRMTQAELGEKIDKVPATIGAWENGRRSIFEDVRRDQYIANLNKLADALDLSREDRAYFLSAIITCNDYRSMMGVRSADSHGRG